MIPIIDSHIHVYPAKIAEKASQAISDFYQIRNSYDGTLPVLLAQERAAGITHCIVSSVATTPKQVHAINSYLSEAVASQPDYLSGLGALHPLSEDPERDVNEILSLGLKGVKMHADIQGFRLDDPRMMQLYELCQDRLPMLLHFGDYRYDYSNPNRVKAVLKSFPHLTVIGAHFAGWSIWDEATESLHGCDNLIVDCSSSMYALSEQRVAELIRVWGAERVLFGTDYPLMSPVQEVARFQALPLTQAERERILYRNASALYHLCV